MGARASGERGRSGEKGLFEPGSPIRRVHREGVLLLGGGRALLLQLAHPLVAEGVEAHSNFRADPLGRLRRTLDTMLAIVFGDRETALAWAGRVRETHTRVRGTLREAAGPFPASTPYEANDPALLLWVHATLIDTSLRVYRDFFGPLDSPALLRYYEETKRMAGVLGAPAASVLSLVTAALLPDRLREKYDLPWGPGRAAAWRAMRGAGRLAVPRLPHLLRDMSQARRPPGFPPPAGATHP
ncbi:MAG: oxygenase MpaB family protein [Deltaproteobacteria bacterium]|nr:oxygenase MpaB family protein [Deltaproteobacteria bacterium]